MTPEHWRLVRAAFEAARSCAPGDRLTILNKYCGANTALRAEVEKLLAHDARASHDNFLEQTIPMSSRSARRTGRHRLALSRF